MKFSFSVLILIFHYLLAKLFELFSLLFENVLIIILAYSLR